MIATETLKLNLGSRDRFIPGYKNMDIDAHPGVDFVGDVSDLSRFEDCSVSAVFASNILEHFPHTRTNNVLTEWKRVLRPGGALYLSVPDFSRAVEIYHSCGLKDWIQNQLMGDQEYATAFHYAIFDEKRLRDIVMDVGFRECSAVERFEFADKNDCSNNVSNIDGKLVSLNMVARK